MAHIIDGKEISKQIRDDVKRQVSELVAAGKQPPGLAVILVGDDPASSVYVNSKIKACERLGILSLSEKLPVDTPESAVIALVEKFNNDARINGILVQLPLPPHINEARVINTISPDKDVDGLHPFNIGLLASGKPRFIPCTPFGILQLLKRSSIKTAGKEAVVLGRSNLVGKPISNLLSLKADYGNATVTLCHSRSQNLPEICRRADILIVAIGKREFVTGHMIKPGAVVIDVGIHRRREEEGGGICGDVAFAEAADIASAITPVPGGVGPMTIAMLMHNTLYSYKLANPA